MKLSYRLKSFSYDKISTIIMKVSLNCSLWQLYPKFKIPTCTKSFQPEPVPNPTSLAGWIQILHNSESPIEIHPIYTRSSTILINSRILFSIGTRSSSYAQRNLTHSLKGVQMLNLLHICKFCVKANAMSFFSFLLGQWSLITRKINGLGGVKSHTLYQIQEASIIARTVFEVFESH